MTKTTRLALAAVVLTAGIGGATPAFAAGCNGVVDILKWGCAPWDNNNGPKFPYFKKTVTARTLPAGTPFQNKDGNLMVKIDGQWRPVENSAPVIAAGGLNGTSGVIAAGGLNARIVQGN